MVTKLLLNGGKSMEYFWKKDEGAYHWIFMCSHVPGDVRSNSLWTVSDKEPSGKEKCDECIVLRSF